MKWLTDQFTTPLGLNVIGGILAAIAYAAIVGGGNFLRRTFRQRRFKAFFGSDLWANGLTLVFPEFVLKAGAPPSWWVKPGGKRPGKEWDPKTPADVGDLKAISHLSRLFGSELRQPALLASDDEVHEILDANFAIVAFGSNLKSCDAFTNAAASRLISGTGLSINVDESKIMLVNGGPVSHEPGFEYALILKIYPFEFPRRTWFVCAGEHGAGTPAAAWFLANKWRELYRRVGARPFAAVVKAKAGQDQSAVLVDVVS